MITAAQRRLSPILLDVMGLSDTKKTWWHDFMIGVETMPCYHPLKGFPIGVNKSGKTKYKIVPYKVHHLELKNGNFIPVDIDTVSAAATRVIRDFVEISCGHCIGCRLEYSKQWANRCMLELPYHDQSWFVTLTYNNEHVPISQYVDSQTGEVCESMTLRKRDIQLFMKRLRKAFPDDHIRFFCAGEYGPKTLRPHYHLILFGLHLDDLVVYKKSDQDFIYYNSPSLQKCWSVRFNGQLQDIGFAVAAEVSWETCAYVARYVTKKLTGDQAVLYNSFNIEPPFSLMSRKPGIARQWYDDHPDLYDYEYINVPTPQGGRKFRPPRYFDRLYDLDCPDESLIMKAHRRELAENSREVKLSRTNLDYEELLTVEEQAKEKVIQVLKRRL